MIAWASPFFVLCGADPAKCVRRSCKTTNSIAFGSLLLDWFARLTPEQCYHVLFCSICVWVEVLYVVNAATSIEIDFLRSQTRDGRINVCVFRVLVCKP